MPVTALDQPTADSIRLAAGAGITRRALARKHRVSRSTIDRIIHAPAYGAVAPRPGHVRRSRLVDSGGKVRPASRTWTLLRSLGVPRSELGPGNREFFRANGLNVEFIGRLAKQAYLDRMRLTHPDAGGDAKETVLLNQLFSLIRSRFARRGIHL